MTETQGQAGTLTEEVSSLPYPYLRAWTDEQLPDDASFDACATVGELSEFLRRKVAELVA